MSELTFTIDDKMTQSMEGMMRHYGVKTKADLISKAIAILKIASHVDETHGELIARKDGRETKIKVF